MANYSWIVRKIVARHIRAGQERQGARPPKTFPVPVSFDEGRQAAIDHHLRHEPSQPSRSRIKRLREVRRPQFRLRVGEVRVFYECWRLLRNRKRNHGSRSSGVSSKAGPLVAGEGRPLVVLAGSRKAGECHNATWQACGRVDRLRSRKRIGSNIGWRPIRAFFGAPRARAPPSALGEAYASRTWTEASERP